jgi:hypothetical protein
MNREILTRVGAAMPWVPCFGLILFLAVFVGALIWASRRRNAPLFEALSQLPLND